VFVTKRPGKVFTAKHLKRLDLEEIFQPVCADFEVELKEANGVLERICW
jgi:REP element-mobilizing transposase RayT